MWLISKAYRRRSKVAIINLIYYTSVIYHNSVHSVHMPLHEKDFSCKIQGEDGELKPAQVSKVSSLFMLLLMQTHIYMYTLYKDRYSWPLQNTGLSIRKLLSRLGQRPINSIFICSQQDKWEILLTGKRNIEEEEKSGISCTHRIFFQIPSFGSQHTCTV